MAVKKKLTQAQRNEKCQKRLERVCFLARRWARHAEQMNVLASPSHHLLRAIQLWEAETSEAPRS